MLASAEDESAGGRAGISSRRIAVDDGDPPAVEHQACGLLPLAVVAGGPHGGGGEQRGDAEAVGEADVTAEHGAHDMGEPLQLGEPAAELPGYELGAQPLLSQQRLGGPGHLAAVVRAQQREVAVRVGRVEGVAGTARDPGHRGADGERPRSS